MKRNLTFDELKEINVMRCEEVYHPFFEWTPSEIGNDLAGEVGELCNVIKKIRRQFYEKNMTEQEKAEQFKIYLSDAKKELADVILYATIMAAALNIDIDAAIIQKFNETSKKINSKLFLK